MIFVTPKVFTEEDVIQIDMSEDYTQGINLITFDTLEGTFIFEEAKNSANVYHL